MQRRIPRRGTRKRSDLRYNFVIIRETFVARNSIELVIDVAATECRLTAAIRHNDEIDVQHPITSKTFNPLRAVKFPPL